MIDAIITTWSRDDVLRIAAFSLATTLLWRVPLIGLAFYPFLLLNTFVHELSHGVAALLTGGEFKRFVVYPDRTGVALIRGGSQFVVASAGYLGAALFGGLLILLSATALAVQTLLLGLGIGLGLLCLMFVRNGFGFLTGLLLAGGLGAAGWYLADEPARLLFTVLALQMPLASINSLVDLVRLSVRPGHPDQLSDAHVLARQTRIPALIWALLWFLTALVIVVVTVTVAYQHVPISI